GETPPGESSTGSETGPPIDLTRGWGTWPLVVIGVIGAVFAAFFLMYAILLVV
ncbi:membrane protein, partial [Streptomyces sp. AcH 505]